MGGQGCMHAVEAEGVANVRGYRGQSKGAGAGGGVVGGQGCMHAVEAEGVANVRGYRGQSKGAGAGGGVVEGSRTSDLKCSV